MDIPNTQQQYELTKPGKAFVLRLNQSASVRRPGDHEVLLRVRATSLNRRDVAIRAGFYPVGNHEALVPLSDGAGEVVAIGPKVKRVALGDRVAANFFQTWLQGRATDKTGASALGGAQHGMLAQYVTLHEDGLVHIPGYLSFEDAASLPCAAVTAWNGLMTRGRLHAGDNVLLQGTGGVSIFGLQFAVAAGAKPVITSSSDDKIARALKMGAVGGVNYKNTPDWEKPLRALTSDVGAHHVLEVGGTGTLAKSLASLAVGGHVALIGGLAGFGGDIPAVALIGKSASASGIFVGSRADFEAMLQFMQHHRIKPVIDHMFEFFDVEAAYAAMDSALHFGKIVIRH